MRCAVIIPAAGSGSRFGGATPKQYLPLRGRPVLAYAVERFLREESVVRLVIAAAPEYHPTLNDMISSYAWRDARVVEGGETRQESVARGLDAIGDDAEIVAVHDAVRPFFQSITFRRVLAAAADAGAALPVMPLSDTIHRVDSDRVVETLDRSSLVAAQTPQCFRASVLRDALDRARRDGAQATDEASLCARYGAMVRTVVGDAMNVKITRPEDLVAAESNFDRWAGELETQ